jgi:DNA modification methylase
MNAPYYTDDYLTLHHGDAAETLAELVAESVQTVVTSPPYYGLRDYGTGDAQLGLETSPAEYVSRLASVFHQLKRVLRSDGTFWLNLGDGYVSHGGAAGRLAATGLQGTHPRSSPEVDGPHTFGRWNKQWDRAPKNLIGMPWRIAFALQDDGWILRNAIVWDKPNAMPESVTDRLATTYELVFLLAKSKRYYFDLDPIREPTVTSNQPRPLGGRNLTPRHVAATDNTGWKDHAVSAHPEGRNPGDVWTIPTSPYPGAHFAVMPPALVRRCILAGAPEGATVLDPFIGSGTVAMVANQLGRRAIGIDLNAAYLDLAMQRCKDAPLPFGEAVS